MIVFLSIIICLGIYVFTRIVHNYVQNEIRHNVRENNLFIEKFLSSDHYLAKSYANRSKLNEFQIIPIESFSSQKAIRKYAKLQDKSLDRLKECFKCLHVTSLFQNNPNIEYMMDTEITCLNHEFCSSCPHKHEC